VGLRACDGAIENRMQWGRVRVLPRYGLVARGTELCLRILVLWEVTQCHWVVEPLKMKATIVRNVRTTERHIPDALDRQQDRCETLKLYDSYPSLRVCSKN